MSLTSELLELSQHLQQEYLFVTTEREQLQRLFHTVSVLSERVFHTAWIARQQKLNLQQFIDQGNRHDDSLEVFGVNNELEDTSFLDSYKVLSYHDTKYSELLKFLYENPSLLATLIIEGEKLGGLNVRQMISMTVSSIYGNCIFREDEQAVLRLLKSLFDSQVANSENPRRLIRRGNLSFSLVFKHLCESLFSARLFLTAALYEPIMRLLMEDDWFYDIDPDKAFVRFPNAEKLRRFGVPGTAEHAEAQAKYRTYIVGKLEYLAMRFINCIKANIQCFPASLGWLVSQVYRVLTERGQVNMQEVRACCADLVFALFICPAICDPEPHGITSDVPISHIAKHNLMQMAQIIQVLAILQWDEIDPKVKDLYGRFEKGCMSSVLDLFLEGPWEDMTDQLAAPQCFGPGAARSAVLLTTSDIRATVGFLRNTSCLLEDKNPQKKYLEQLLSCLPADIPPSSAADTSQGGVMTPSTGSGGSSGVTSFNLEPAGTPTSERKALFRSKSQRKKRSNTFAPQTEDVMGESVEVDARNKASNEVLVLTIYPPGDCPGMLPEKKVLASVQGVDTGSEKPPLEEPSNPTAATTSSPAAPNPEIQEKRTRFSLSHDQESIGNASDYQEVVSEAASSHSVEDENELETDNFSDMMSANVSGRGSPSISGRDTPLSQAGSVEENPPPPQLPVPVPETVRKENRVDVTDRFGKFEIKPELGMERDECKSTVSDTWSTDVLASDSEPPEQNQFDRLEEVAEEISRPLLLCSEPISEISETASDAWSTDVLASDTDEKHSELLKDLEQDLISGVLDRDEGDNSLGHEDGEEHILELEHMGAVGGAGSGHISHHHQHQPLPSDSSDTFPDVFTETPTKLSDDLIDRGNSSKKIPSTVHNFQSGPNLQLPSLHRPSPQSSQRYAEAKGMSGFEAAPTTSSVTSNQPAGMPAHFSSGTRNKHRDGRDRRKESRGSASEDNAAVAEFDPLATAGHGSGNSSGFKPFKNKKWSWSRGSGKHMASASGDSPQPAASSQPPDVPSLPHDSSPSGSAHPDLPTPPNIGSGRSGSRDSGIDIWVNTNGQMSGSSSLSSATTVGLVNSRSSLDSSVSPRYASHLPGRSSLDTNLQRLQSAGRAGRTVPGMTSTPDSGIHSTSFLSSTRGSSLDSVPPLEMDNPLFHLVNPADSSSAKNHSPISEFTTPPVGDSSSSSASKMEDNKSLPLLTDTQPESEQIIHENDLKFRHRKLRRSTPQIEVTDIFKKISIIEGEGEEEDDQLFTGEATTGEYQLSNLNERRLSSAVTDFDPFAPESHYSPPDLTVAGVAGPIHRDTSISFADTVKGHDGHLGKLCEDQDGPVSSKVNGSAVLVDGCSGKADGEEEHSTAHRRQDSSGSSQSANSFKLNTSGDGTSKEGGGDNISLASLDRGFGENEESQGVKGRKSGGPGFLRSVREKFNKGIKKKSTKFDKDLSDPGEVVEVVPSPSPSPQPQATASKEPPSLLSTDSTDDILAKYRSPKKAQTKSNNNNSNSAVNNNTAGSSSNGDSNGTTKADPTDIGPVGGAAGGGEGGVGAGNHAAGPDSTNGLHRDVGSDPPGDSRPLYFDSDHLETCPAFEDAKRKLRLVLSMGDVYICLSQVQSSSPREGVSSRENEVINLLNAQLAEAINLQNKDSVTQLYEVIRCIKMFDTDGCKKLLRSMREDYGNRSAYVSYLVRCRQGLLATSNQLQRLLNRVKRDKEICSKHLTNVCARSFLDQRERKMLRFVSEFQKLSMSDERIDLVEQFLFNLYQEMGANGLWKAATDKQIEDGQQAVERFLMSRIYSHAMFPNGDGDLMRDEVLQEHMRKLGRVISPLHKDLRIPRMYHMECPWPAAQKEIYMINAYRTPKDKIQCVLRCSQTIMNLLSMANVQSVPAADDFMPVLIFVLIKANPFLLLSTIQYVNSFYENRLKGEEQYWWLQLTSAVEFIKTMDYSQ